MVITGLKMSGYSFSEWLTALTKGKTPLGMDIAIEGDSIVIARRALVARVPVVPGRVSLSDADFAIAQCVGALPLRSHDSVHGNIFELGIGSMVYVPSRQKPKLYCCVDDFQWRDIQRACAGVERFATAGC